MLATLLHDLVAWLDAYHANPFDYINGPIILVGMLTAMSCAILGNFLLLKKMSMMGDAISHAVLPGLAIAFLLTGSRDAWPMFVGAAFVGLLTAFFTQWVHALGKVDEGASMGVVFTSLFALGLVLIVQAADTVDLDPDCVLHGVMETAPIDTVSLAGLTLPRLAVRSGIVLLFNLLVVLALYKEFKISTFDPQLARTAGIHAGAMHYLLMALVAVTTVASFEAVGSILVIAMLIVPAATARLLTHRLSVMIVLSLVIAAAGAFFGQLAAVTVPPALNLADDTTSGGAMVAVTGLLFALAVVFAPQRGVVAQWLRRAALRLSIARDDALALLYRLDEVGLNEQRQRMPQLLRELLNTPRWLTRFAIWQLVRRGALATDGPALVLTDRGRHRAQDLVRSHRLWESYLEKHMHVPVEHTHFTAEQFEHITTAAMQADLVKETGARPTDPHGRDIPPAIDR
jgi:manganese/zinc/iron transport system permease protein